MTQTINAGVRQDRVEVQYRDGDGEEWRSAIVARLPPGKIKGYIDLHEPILARQGRVLARADNAVDESHAWTPVSLEFYSPIARGPDGT